VGSIEHYSRESPEDAKYRREMIRQIREDSVSDVKKLLLPENIPRGFDINSLDPQGYSFLHHAVLRSTLEIAHALIAAGADVNIPKQGLAATFAGIYPIFDSAVMGDLPMIQLLIENKADIERRSRGVTPFLAVVHGASDFKSLKMLAYLGVEGGADYAAQDVDGRNAFDILRDTLRLRQGDEIDYVQNCVALLFVIFRGEPHYAVGVQDAEAAGGVRLKPVAADFGMTDHALTAKVEEFKPLLGSAQSRRSAVLLYGQRAREAAAAARTGAAAGAGAAAPPAASPAGEGAPPAASPAAAGAGAAAAAAPVGPGAFQEWAKEWAKKQRTGGRRRRRKTQRRRSRRVKQRRTLGRRRRV
jgi:hypothetical protein